MENDQEKYLDDSIKVINNQIFHLGKAIENNNLRIALKECSLMLAELKSCVLTPRNYYHVFSMVLDELHFVYLFFKEEVRRGRKIKHLFDSVQQSHSIIPRLYLMITAGKVYIESGEINIMFLIFELLNAIKGVQNPTRGLFLRYYLLKMMKEKIPDTEEDLDLVLKFILQNLEEMNRLWIRLSTGCSGNEKLLREKERSELQVLVGENIVRMSDLTYLKLDKYQNEVLPKLISILLDAKDSLSQQYLLECIIHAFDESFNIACMSQILDSLTKVSPNVDIKTLFINLMERISKFIEKFNGNKLNNEEKMLNNFDIQKEIEKIFGVLKENIDKLVEENLKNQNSDEIKVLELQVAFMNFTLKCCPENQKLDTVNHIARSVFVALKGSNVPKLSKDCVKQVLKILTLPLDNNISIFKLELFTEIMGFIDSNSKNQLALNIVENQSKAIKEEDVLNNINKVQSVLSYIKPLTEGDEPTSKDQLSYEQQMVCKLVYAIREKNPEKYYEMLKLLQFNFEKGGDRKKHTLPTLINAYIDLSNKCYISFYEQKNYFTVSFNEDQFHSFIQDIHNNIISIVKQNLIGSYTFTFDLLTQSLFSVNYFSKLGSKQQDISHKIVNVLYSLIESQDKQLHGNFQLAF